MCFEHSLLLIVPAGISAQQSSPSQVAGHLERGRGSSSKWPVLFRFLGTSGRCSRQQSTAFEQQSRHLS